MKKQRFKQLIIMVICAVFVACAGFAVSDYFKRENTITAHAAVSPNIYWGVNGDTLTFDTSLVGGSPSGNIINGDFISSSNTYYNEVYRNKTIKDQIKTVTFANKVSFSSLEYFFDSFTNLQKVENIADNLDLSNVDSIEGMFYECSSLTEIDVKGWDISNINRISYLFYGCSSLKTIDLSDWNTSKVYNMNAMFRNCSGLTSIDVSKWNVSNLELMFNAFYGCSELTRIDLSEWKTKKLISVGRAFEGCTKLRSVDLSGFVIASSNNRIEDMFNNTPALEALKLSSSLVSTFKNPNPAPNVSVEQEPKLPILKDKKGNQYPTVTDSDGNVFADVSSLPAGGGVFLTTVKHTHEYDSIDDRITNPTCTTGGYTDRTCYMCDEVTRVNPTNSLGHSLNPIDAKDKTCTTDGNIAYFSCSRCSKKFNDGLGSTELSDSDIKIAASHNLSHVDGVDETCTDTGTWEHYHCADCGKNFGDAAGKNELTSITKPAKRHKYTNYSSNNDATCLADGTKTANCDNGCGTTDTVTDTGSALGHDFSVNISGTPPTCQHGGSAVMQCSRCTETETQSSGSPVPHSYTNYVSNGDATCTVDGTKTAQCDFGCGTEDTQPDAGSALGHSFTNYVSNGDATYTADGTKTAQCDHGCGASDTQPDIGSMLGDVRITVTIHAASSVVGADLEALTATVTSGTLIDPADVPYTLSTDADKDVIGTYTITGTCTDSRYNITFIDGVYIVSKKADDPNGGGEIDLPIDIDVRFEVEQRESGNVYPTDGDYMNRGCWAQLWEQTADGDKEYTGKLKGDDGLEKSCILTLTVPEKIINAILNGGQIDLDKIAANLGVSYVSAYSDESGEKVPSALTAVDNFKLRKNGSEYTVKFTYDGDFGAEIVFSALNAPEPEEPAAGIPWWVWLLVGLGGAAVVGVVVVIIVVAKKKSAASVVVGEAYDDAELKAKLSEQDKKLDEIKEIVDGGFNDIVDDE